MSDDPDLTVRPANGQPSREEIAERAHEVEQGIVKYASIARSALTRLAPLLLAMYEERLWEVLDYDSMNQFLASPYIEISPSYAKALKDTYRDLVVERGVPEKELEGLDLRKLQMALPAVKAGDVHWQEAVSDARALARHDMAVRYRRGPNRRLNAAEEPERVRCPVCDQWTDRSTVEEADAA